MIKYESCPCDTGAAYGPHGGNRKAGQARLSGGAGFYVCANHLALYEAAGYNIEKARLTEPWIPLIISGRKKRR